MQPAVLIPVAIATAVLVVSGMIMYQIFGNGNRCTRLKPEDEEGQHSQPDEEDLYGGYIRQDQLSKRSGGKGGAMETPIN